MGITRNAANSIARIGAGVGASGGTLDLSATTGQDSSQLPSNVTNPTKAAEAFVVGGTIGGVAIGIAYGDVKLQTASVAESDGSLGFTTATVAASDTTDAKADVIGVAAGSGAFNIAVSKAEKQGTVGALITGSSYGQNLTVSATGGGGTVADTTAASGGVLFAGNAAVATANDSRTVSATVGEATLIAAQNFTLHASATPSLDAESFGIAVSGEVAAGASVANATSSSTVTAQVGEGATLGCGIWCASSGAFLINADVVKALGGSYNIVANAIGSAGGALVGLNGTSAIASNSSTVNADIGVNLDNISSAATLLGPVALTVEAQRSVSQDATTTGVTAAGLLAIGVQRAEADSSGTVEAGLLHVDGSNRGFGANATVTASSTDINEAGATAGAGGLGAGVAALAITSTGGSVTANVTPNAGDIFRAGQLTVDATSSADYRAIGDATEASVVGGSGSTTQNSVNTSATVNFGQALAAGSALGSNSRVEASRFSVHADNVVGPGSSSDGGYVRGAGGGVANGAAALITNKVTQDAQVNILEGTTLRQYGGDPTLNTIATLIDASIETNRAHSAALEVGGVAEFPFAKINSSYTGTTGVTIGQNTLIRGDQGIGIGTLANQQLADTTAVQIYGLAGVGGGDVDTETNVHQTVKVGDGATIEGIGDVRVAAGTAANGNSQDVVSNKAQTDVFNWTLLPISVDHGATADSTVVNQLNLGAAIIRSARDVSLSSLGGSINASATGTGHNPYLALFGATDSGGDANSSGTGTIMLDGTQVTAGFLAQRRFTIADDNAGGWIATETDFDGRNTVTSTLKSDGSTTVPADALGRFAVASTSTNAAALVNQQIASLQAQYPGIVDPNQYASGTAQHTAAQAALDTAAASSADIARLSQLFDTRAALTDPNSAASPANGVAVGSVFAAGGLVGIDADSIVAGARKASVVATSSPTIAITNNSSLNLVLGDLFIPSKPSGAVTYGGAAGAAQLSAAATIVKAGASDTPDGLIAVTDGAPFTGTRSDVLEVGNVTNVGGSLSVTANNGNYAQFGLVQVGSFSAQIPNGVFSVSEPYTQYSQGVPIDLYYGNLGYQLYANKNNQDSNQLGANDAAQFIASYVAESAFNDSQGNIADGANGASRLAAAANTAYAIPTNSNVLAGLFLNSSYRVDIYGNSNSFVKNSNGQYVRTLAIPNGLAVGATIWTGCPNQACELESDDDELNSQLGHGDYAIGNSAPKSNGQDTRYFSSPTITFTDPVRQYSLNGAVKNASYPTGGGGGGTSGGAINAVQVQINAATVDLSGTITAGPNKTRAVTVNAEPGDSAFNQLTLTNGKSAPLQTVGLASGNIGVRWVADPTNPKGGYLQVDDVSAGAGGSIEITGRILNSNPLGGGKLVVLNGFANISVTNYSDVDLHLGTLNAGSNVSGTIKLVDLQPNGSGGTTTETTIYRDTPGQAVTVDHSTNGVVDPRQVLALGAGTSDATALTYQPRGSAYYLFSDSRDITRTSLYSKYHNDYDWGGYTTAGLAASQWQWSNAGGQAPQSGSYVDLANIYDGNASTLNNALGSARPDAVQIISGYVTSYVNWNISRNDPDQTFVVPDAINVQVQTAVKATYPIHLVFNPGNGGGINVQSSAGGVVVGGPVVFGNGLVSVTAGRSITGTANGSILAHSVSLTSQTGDIGTPAVLNSDGTVKTAAIPLAVSVAGSDASGAGKVDGFVDAFAFNGSVTLAVASTTTTNGALDAVALDYVDAAGPIVISSAGGVLGTNHVGGNLIGNGVTLNVGGGVGGIGPAPSNTLLAPALVVNLGTGALNIAAGGNVTVEAAYQAGVTDALRLGAITTTGDVLLRGWGSIIAASDATTVDQDKLKRFLTSAAALQLAPTQVCAPGDANCSINPQKLAAVETQVRTQAKTAYDVVSRTLAQSQAVDAVDTEGKVGVINGLLAQGVQLGSDWTVTLGSTANIAPGSALYTLALETLHTRNDALPGTANETITLPTQADIVRGLQAYVDKTRAPLVNLFGASATPTAVLSLTTLPALEAAIPSTGYQTAATADYNAAVATLTQIFGFVPAGKGAIDTLAFAPGYLDSRTTGATWTQSELDFAVPSTAFVPVADTQFETRAPVITARNVTLVAGNSIGNLAAPKTFTFTSAGLVNTDGTAVTQSQKDLAAAYLAAAGPGDLAVTITNTVPGDATTPISSVAFTTRRDDPLQLAASGIINAFAATNPHTLVSTNSGTDTAVVAGDIFLSNTDDFHVGSIISQKGRSDANARSDCNTSVNASLLGCDSSVHLQGNSIVGETSGAALLVSSGTLLSNPAGRSIVMGGLVRLEASNGNLESTDGSAILVDARALETVRSAGDIALAKRAPVIPFANPDTGGGYSFGNDLVVGDTFAAGTLTLDNPVGSFFVGALPSNIASEDRNARIVAGTLQIRAAGDIGAGGDNALTGRSNQFDITAPVIRIFVAGYDYSGVTGVNFGAGKVGIGPAPNGLPEGDGFFALRGVSTIGGPGSVLGACNDITIGSVADYSDPNRPPPTTGSGNGIGIVGNNVPNIFSSIDIESSIQIGGAFNLTTDGSLNFGPDVNINSLGKSAGSSVPGHTCASNPTDPGCELDLSRLHLNLLGTFNITSPRSLLFGSISAGGGQITSTQGYVNVSGTLFGIGGPDSPFTVVGKTGVTAGSVGAGAVSLVSSAGDVTVTGLARSSDFTANGVDVYMQAGVFGRSATLTATGPAGIVELDGPAIFQRVDGSTIPANLTANGHTILVNSILGADDNIALTASGAGGAIAFGPRSAIVNAQAATLIAPQIGFAPNTVLNDVGTLTLTETADKTVSGKLVIPTFSGSTLIASAPTEIDAGTIVATGGVQLTTAGLVVLGGEVDAGGMVAISANALNAMADIASSGAISIYTKKQVAAANRTFASSGPVNITETGDLVLGSLKAQSGAVTAYGGGIILSGGLVTAGGPFKLTAGNAVALNGVDITGALTAIAGTDLTLGGNVAVRSNGPLDIVSFNAGGTVKVGPKVKIQGYGPTARVAINGGQVVFDPASSLRGSSVAIMSKGAATVSAFYADPTQNQTVSVRTHDALNLITANGTSVSLSSSNGGVTVTGALSGGPLSISAAQDIATNGITSSAATLNPSLGSARLSGVTRVNGISQSAARLAVTAAKTVTIDGATSAAGGITLIGQSVLTTPNGYLTDLDHPGVLTSLRANSVNVTFNTGLLTGPAVRVDSRGRSATSSTDAVFHFNTLRPVLFDNLSADRGTIYANTAIQISSLNMADWLWMNFSGRTVALLAAQTPPVATRTIQTGKLTAAKLVVAPGIAPAQPVVMINGALR